MAKSKHRRKGSTRPRGRARWLILPPLTPEADHARQECEDAFLRHIGRSWDDLNDVEFDEIFNSQAWREWAIRYHRERAAGPPTHPQRR